MSKFIPKSKPTHAPTHKCTVNVPPRFEPGGGDRVEGWPSDPLFFNEKEDMICFMNLFSLHNYSFSQCNKMELDQQNETRNCLSTSSNWTVFISQLMRDVIYNFNVVLHHHNPSQHTLEILVLSVARWNFKAPGRIAGFQPPRLRAKKNLCYQEYSMIHPKLTATLVGNNST